MIDLKLNVENEKQFLVELLMDQIDVRAAISVTEDISLGKVTFSDHNVPNKEPLLKEIREDLAIAKTDGLIWDNDIEPALTLVPQGFINFAAQWNAEIDAINAALAGGTQQDRQDLRTLFGGLSGSIDNVVAGLEGLQPPIADLHVKISKDAVNFSDKHASFQQLEKIDEQNLKTAEGELKKLMALVNQLNQRIDADTVSADKKLSAVSNILKYSKKIPEVGQALGLPVATGFLISAVADINDLISAVDQKVNVEGKEILENLIISTLNQQLLALKTANKALSGIATELDDFTTTIAGTIASWNAYQKKIKQVIAELADGGPPPKEILSEFNLGGANANWQQMSTFATKLQALTPGISAAPKNDIELL